MCSPELADFFDFSDEEYLDLSATDSPPFVFVNTLAGQNLSPVIAEQNGGKAGIKLACNIQICNVCGATTTDARLRYIGAVTK